MATYFTPALFSFLRQLESHNNREWFQARRARFEADVETPMLRFIADLGPHLAGISRAVVADPRRTGGSLYRIYRDTRFSADKSPYKINVAASFSHESKRDKKKELASVPGFYLHLEPGDSFGGGGIYHPDMPSLTRIRTAIVQNGKSWAAVKRTGIEIEGDRLVRAPAGFDPAHRFVEDLRCKDLYTLTSFSEEDACEPDFLDRYLESCRKSAPLVGFIAKAMGLRW
jgi:uncharacterized protein (TIGR02453 family)